MEVIGNLIKLRSAPDDLPPLMDLVRSGDPVRVHSETSYELHAPHVVLEAPPITFYDDDTPMPKLPMNSLPIGTKWPMVIPEIVRSTLELMISAEHYMDTVHGLMLNEGMTRRAALPFWSADDLSVEPAEPRTVPSLLAEQFMFRNEKVHLHLFLRALDLTALPFVLFSGSQMLQTFANLVRTPVDSLHLHITSLYLRQNDVGRMIDQVKTPKLDELPPFQPDGLRGTRWSDVASTARGLLEPGIMHRLDRLDPSERWFAETLHERPE